MAESKMTVNAVNGLNLREEPMGKVKKILAHGDKVQIVEDGTTWVKVKAGRIVGYVMRQYLRG